ncbi:MAG: hypothetical protein B0W54_15505 [Cellvibrio sp. 79]|nr:MAG: hypothetical protein B0W54_15505 [Cellvibrio sp. 79]
MTTLKFLAIFPLCIFLISCGNKHAEDQIATNPPASSVDAELLKLKEIINLPLKPTWVKWELNKVTEPTGKLDTDDWSIIARMTLEKNDIKILANTQLPIKVMKLPAYAVEPWMEDLIATSFKLDENGEYKPLGTTLSAEQFYRDPLITGAIYMISETEILLFLQTE